MKQTITPELAADLVADPGKAQCPACNQRGFWDNRENKKNPKAPDYKCKNKNCDVGNGYPCGVYVRDFPAGLAPAAKASNGSGPRVSVTWKQLKLAYHECVAMALHEAGEIGKTGTPITADDIAAMANTLMITRDKTNCWPQQVAPTPPPPKPPEPSVEEYDYSNEENLPF